MFKKETIVLGKGHVTKWTICEFKKWFSIYVHDWHTEEQDRFHTHAFNAWAIMLCGWYREEYYSPQGTFLTKTVFPGIRHIPREYCHRILECSAAHDFRKRCWTVAFTGPWHKAWYEISWTLRRWRKLGWSREVLEEGIGLPSVLD